ncbi:permeases of the major facilitator superfamily protein [Coccidioides immitis RMSCC 2394]|uniref:Permeases of the major facilitator superfamily protein n=1 Tax=Coccidioides immitis RMSCC 2394 TaxID=404692 RepID=A0A0J6Y5V1_COCIT|nr:permeases of the major facilitator superfamily protein [Coccidioides immitis RMSCC 2394]
MTDSEKTTAVAVSQSTLELDEKRPDPGPHPGEAKKKCAPETQLEDEGGSSRPSSVHTNLSDREPVENLELGPVTTGSSVSPPPVSIPMSKRRGLLAQLALVPEVEEPKHYPRKTKWFITFVIGVAAHGCAHGKRNLFPEKLGRRTIYLVSFALFVLWSVLSAIASSIGMLIVMRLLGGGASASVQAVGAGTIADIWEVKERGRAMGIFYLGPLCGPLLAPIIGGVLSQAWDWRSTQWFLAIYGGVGFLLLLFGLPETLPRPKKPSADSQESVQRSLSRVSSRQVVEATAKWLKLARIVFIDPLGILLYLRFPAVLLTVYYGSIAFGSLYILNISVQDTFSKAPYNFSMLIVGLLYIPNSLGYIVASLTGGPWMDRIMQREARRANRVDENGKLIYRPEDRMRENAWLGAILYPVALIVYGWTAEKGVYWIVPIICNFFFGLGSMIIFSMSTTMLTEFMPKKSSSGVAVNNFARNTFSCIGGIVTAPIIHGIGNGWLFTIIGLVALASCSVIWAMKKFGPQWRVSMDARLG